MTAQKIKQVSLHLFAEKGFEGTSLSGIAKGVGIKKPSIYAHFINKDDIYLAVFEEVFSKYVHAITEAYEEIQSRPVEEKIYHLLHTTCKYSSQHQASIVMFKRAILFPPPHLKEIIQKKALEFEKKQEKMLSQLFTEAIEKGMIAKQPIEQLISSYFCILDGNVFHLFFYKEHQKLDYEAHEAHNEERMMNIWKIYWQGLCVEKEAGLRL